MSRRSTGGQGGSGSNEEVADVKPAILGSFAIDSFDPASATWKRWLQRLSGAFKVFGMEDHMRVPYLLHYVGSAAFDMLCDRLDPVDPYAESFESLVKKLEEFYDPAPLEIAENYIFHQRRQEEQENVQQFMAALHKLSINCKFGQYHKTALRNQLVFGLRSKKAQTRLLEKKDLTLDEAINIAVTMELTEKGTAQMSTNTNGRNMSPARVNYVKAGKKPITKNLASKSSTKNAVPKNTNNQPGRFRDKSVGKFHKQNPANKNIKCYRCGQPHYATECTMSKDVICHKCNKPGHIRTVCKSKYGAATSLDCIEEINSVEHTAFRDKFLRTLEVNGKYINFEIDTGAAVTIMSEYDKFLYFKNVTVQNTNVKLVSY